MSVTQKDQSELMFGGYDTDKFVGAIQWHPVINKLFWSLKLDDIKYNGVPMNLCAGKTCMITPDSGTSLLTAPKWALTIIESILPQKEDCIDPNTFGTLSYVIDGIDYTIPSHHFMSLYTDVYQPGDSVCMTSMTDLDIMQPGQ